mmetsp:Transcript_84297/g.167387  ORF Transcript_84297/g.167387 Transcript_84297/m.167387 type:complete len:210 (+) Transcript_84297:72-701(+)
MSCCCCSSSCRSNCCSSKNVLQENMTNKLHQDHGASAEKVKQWCTIILVFALYEARCHGHTTACVVDKFIANYVCRCVVWRSNAKTRTLPKVEANACTAIVSNAALVHLWLRPSLCQHAMQLVSLNSAATNLATTTVRKTQATAWRTSDNAVQQSRYGGCTTCDNAAFNATSLQHWATSRYVYTLTTDCLHTAAKREVDHTSTLLANEA